ncbi:hypothetical protein PHYC_03848 [Phycisphaerales bacterium]|nr:hypothetical protein PHYC_03848 [Phycisphaerales bacterium]
MPRKRIPTVTNETLRESLRDAAEAVRSAIAGNAWLKIAMRRSAMRRLGKLGRRKAEPTTPVPERVPPRCQHRALLAAVHDAVFEPIDEPVILQNSDILTTKPTAALKRQAAQWKAWKKAITRGVSPDATPELLAIALNGTLRAHPSTRLFDVLNELTFLSFAATSLRKLGESRARTAAAHESYRGLLVRDATRRLNERVRAGEKIGLEKGFGILGKAESRLPDLPKELPQQTADLKGVPEQLAELCESGLEAVTARGARVVDLAENPETDRYSTAVIAMLQEGLSLAPMVEIAVLNSSWPTTVEATRLDAIVARAAKFRANLQAAMAVPNIWGRLDSEAKAKDAPLPSGAESLWQALAGAVMDRAALARELECQPGTVGSHVNRIRRQRGKGCIERLRNGGYYRPDSPPPPEVLEAARNRPRRRSRF